MLRIKTHPSWMPKFHKETSKNLQCHFSNDLLDEESVFDQMNNVLALIHLKEVSNSDNTFFDDNGDINDEDELSNDALSEAYKNLHLKWTEEYQVSEK